MKVNCKALLLLALLCLCALQAAVGKHRNQRRWREEAEEEWETEEEEEEEEEEMKKHHHEDEDEDEDEGKQEPRGEDLFLLGEGKRVMGSEAGEMRVVKGHGYGGARYPERPLHMGFITMEPRSMFLPQYLDSALVLFLQKGDAKLGLIYKDALVERRLRTGDIYRVPAGSVFYLVNTAQGQRLHVICSIDPSVAAFQSFFIGGGSDPKSVLAGFDPETLSTAFNVSIGELKDLMTSQEAGPFVYTDSHVPTHFEAREGSWSWRKLLNGLLGKDDKADREGDVGSGPDPFNIYDANPSFKNDYGSSLAVDKHVYRPLKKARLSVYFVNLTAGTMLAPHMNPVASEYGVVLRGSGTIQIVYPNGTTAVKAKVRQGSVFWVPRYFPFCHIASRSGPLEFFGFSTSAERNHPQFLVGASSVLRTMWGQEFATAFGVTAERLKEMFDAQREAVALPSPSAAPGSEEEDTRVPPGVKVLAREMMMG